MLGLVGIAGTAGATASESWSVQAGKGFGFQRAGEYDTRAGTRLQHAFRAYGAPSRCRPLYGPDHVVATWGTRGILIDAVTYGGLPKGESGCISPDLIWISEIRLSDRRWKTPRGLRVGDRTLKLRALYPNATYTERPRAQYYLRSAHGPCIGSCSPYEDRQGVDYPRLTAQVSDGQVVAFWLPVFAQGE